MPASDFYINKGDKWTPKYEAFVDRMYGAIGQPLNASSTTSLLIGTGVKTLTIEIEKSFAAGQPVRLYYDSSNYMDGVVDSYVSTTGAMQVTVNTVVGTGTYAIWSIGLVGSTIPVDKTINILSKAVNYTILPADLSVGNTILEGDASGGNKTMTLPTIAEMNGKIVTVIAGTDPAGNSLITNTSAGVEFHTSYSQGDFIAVTSNGVKYITLDEDVTVYGEVVKTLDESISGTSITNPFDTNAAKVTDVGGWFDFVTNFRLDNAFPSQVEINYGTMAKGTIKPSPYVSGAYLRVFDITGDDSVVSGTFTIDLAASGYIRPDVTNINTAGTDTLKGDANQAESFFEWRVIKRLR